MPTAKPLISRVFCISGLEWQTLHQQCPILVQRATRINRQSCTSELRRARLSDDISSRVDGDTTVKSKHDGRALKGGVVCRSQFAKKILICSARLGTQPSNSRHFASQAPGNIEVQSVHGWSPTQLSPNIKYHGGVRSERLTGGDAIVATPESVTDQKKSRFEGNWDHSQGKRGEPSKSNGISGKKPSKLGFRTPSDKSDQKSLRRNTKERNEPPSQPDGKSQSKSQSSPAAPKIHGSSAPLQPWQIQKRALLEKFGSTGWSPRKRLSPDTLESVRALHAQSPEKYSTPVLAEQFKISPEAIRRILKSKWRPSEEEQSRRRLRWDNRGRAIWSQMVEIGIKPPKKWRVMGVKKEEKGLLMV